MTAESPHNLPAHFLKTMPKIAVLAGGIGTERNVSIQSGSCVAQALKNAGLNVVLADIAPDKLDILQDNSIDVFFIAMHGTFGEDGQLQKILEEKSLRYTGSGPHASKLAMNKMLSKKTFVKAGIDTPAAIVFDASSNKSRLEKQLQQLADKFVIKPIKQGSSVGISIVSGTAKAVAAAQKCLDQFGDCMIEEFIPGREITIGILCDKPLPIIEIQTKNNFYNYQAKYLDEQTEYLFDTIRNTALTEKIQTVAINCFKNIGCRNFARVDLILGSNEKVYALEVNTIPGFTTHSLLPKAAAKIGLSMSDLCLKIIENTLENKAVKIPPVSQTKVVETNPKPKIPVTNQCIRS